MTRRSSPSAESGPPLALGERLAQAPLPVGVDGVETELGLQLPQRGHELEAVVHRRDDRRVVRRDLAADLVELLAHRNTTTRSASPLKLPCTIMPG